MMNIEYSLKVNVCGLQDDIDITDSSYHMLVRALNKVLINALVYCKKLICNIELKDITQDKLIDPIQDNYHLARLIVIHNQYVKITVNSKVYDYKALVKILEEKGR